MKQVFLIATTMATLATYAQVYTLGAGTSLTNASFNLQAEIGERVLFAGEQPILYLGAQVGFRSNSYPAVSTGLVVGYAWSWNNGKSHELTTMFLVKYDYAPIANSGYKECPPKPFGFIIRHHVYEGFAELSWQQGQIQFAVGYSLGKYIFR